MKVLYVHGDSDFSALIFEEHGYTTQEKLQEIWELANKSHDKEYTLTIDLSTENSYEWEDVYCKALEFGKSDPNFIEFLMDKFADYDDLKCHNWYEVY